MTLIIVYPKAEFGEASIVVDNIALLNGHETTVCKIRESGDYAWVAAGNSLIGDEMMQGFLHARERGVTRVIGPDTWNNTVLVVMNRATGTINAMQGNTSKEGNFIVELVDFTVFGSYQNEWFTVERLATGVALWDLADRAAGTPPPACGHMPIELFLKYGKVAIHKHFEFHEVRERGSVSNIFCSKSL